MIPFMLLAFFLIVASVGLSGYNSLESGDWIWFRDAYWVGIFGVIGSFIWIVIEAIIWWRYYSDDNLRLK